MTHYAIHRYNFGHRPDLFLITLHSSRACPGAQLGNAWTLDEVRAEVKKLRAAGKARKVA